MNQPEPLERRPLKVRRLLFFQTFAAWLARSGITPNQISVLSIFFSLFAGWALTWQGFGLWWAALGIQLRLICNLMDGMVAVEHKQRTALGDLYNEVPDRVSDSFILIGLGLHADVSLSLALLAALLAALTAYIRVLGTAVGAKTYFIGPMAKQQRMALMTGFAVLVPLFSVSEAFNFATVANSILILISAGCFWTIFRRLGRIATDLRSKA
jgi:phosphatidylglycerophosphate synthase